VKNTNIGVFFVRSLWEQNLPKTEEMFRLFFDLQKKFFIGNFGSGPRLETTVEI